MHQEKTLAVESDLLEQGKIREVSPLLGRDHLKSRLPGGLGQVPESAESGDLDALSHAMIMVATNANSGMFAGPVDAFDGRGAVLNEVAEAEANVMRLVEGLEGRGVGVKVRDKQYPHHAARRWISKS